MLPGSDMKIKISPGSGVENIILDNQKGKVSEAIDDNRMATRSLHDTLKSDTNPPITSMQEIYNDAQGFTYQSVRYCDLDRFRDR
jgi:hypothetical protein